MSSGKHLYRAMACALIVLAGCVPTGTVAIMPVQASNQPVVMAPQVSASTTLSYALVWRQHEVQTPGCFFFSGPPLPNNEVRHTLGPDVEVTREGGRLSVRIGDATFSGDETLGPVRLSLSRSFMSGEKWNVSETLDLDSGVSPRSGTYQYRECPQSDNDCESQCTIDSEFSFQ